MSIKLKHNLYNFHQQKKQQLKNNYSFPEFYPIIQHTDVTLKTNKTEPLPEFNYDANYAELINTMKIWLPAMDGFVPKSQTLYNYFYENTEFKETFLYEMQQQDPIIRQLLFWKRYKNSPNPSLTIRANKGLLQYYRRFHNLSINESNNLLCYIQETEPPKICLLSLLLVMFHNSHTHDLSGHPGREKTHATITETYCFPNICTWIAILTQDELLELPNQQIYAKPLNGTTTAISRSFTILQSPYLNGHKKPNLTVFGWEFIRLCNRRCVYTLSCTPPITQK